VSDAHALDRFGVAIRCLAMSRSGRRYEVPQDRARKCKQSWKLHSARWTHPANQKVWHRVLLDDFAGSGTSYVSEGGGKIGTFARLLNRPKIMRRLISADVHV